MFTFMGYFSLLLTLGGPVAVVLLLFWVYQIYKNSKVQVEQSKRIIELLEKNSH